MDRPLHLVTLLLGFSCAAAAEVGVAGAPAEPGKRERRISSRVGEMLSAAAPKFETAAGATATETKGEPASAARDRVTPPDTTKPANSIIRLPEYLVRERKPRALPKLEEVMVPRELESLAMSEFLGDETGLNRALNMFSIASAWKKVPVLGGFVLKDFETNQDRAMRLYRADREAKAWAEAMGLLTPAERAAVASPTGSAPVKK
jgi:hypothetical protein